MEKKKNCCKKIDRKKNCLNIHKIEGVEKNSNLIFSEKLFNFFRFILLRYFLLLNTLKKKITVELKKHRTKLLNAC